MLLIEQETHLCVACLDKFSSAASSLLHSGLPSSNALIAPRGWRGETADTTMADENHRCTVAVFFTH